MKRVVKIVAVLLFVAFVVSACSQYICPAYATDTEVEQSREVEPS